jgi:ribosomal protein S18 acetylase RimI-like enzyme
MAKAPFQIVPVRTPADLDAAIALFRAYAASLDVDLAYQDFEGEVAAMPGAYAPPSGELLLARSADGRAVGCVGLRPMDTPGLCELKRLYVAPEGRRGSVGKSLVDTLITVAQQIGYREMRLDTLPSMALAQALYRKLGLEITEPYYDSPVPGALFMRRRIS